MEYTLKKHLEYNLWASIQFAGFLRKQDDSIINKELKSSFPGIGKTILHLWNAQLIWLNRMKGEEITFHPYRDFKGTKEEMLDGFIASAEELNELIAARDEAYMDEMIHYKTSKGDAFESRVDEILFHIVNHGSYHRGQIITMLRELGITESLPGTDLILFLRML